MNVRRVAESDLGTVVAMVHELAAYERAAEQCQLTEQQLQAALFGERPARLTGDALSALAAGH